MQDGLDFVDLQNPKVCQPSVRFEHRIVIRTGVSRYTVPVNRSVEHAADVGARPGAAVHAEADEATPELVHDHEHLVAPEHDRLAAKEVDAPEAVCGVANERQP